MSNEKKQLLDKILINLKKAKNIRENTKKDVKLFNAKIALKQFQVERLKNTHKDLLESNDTKSAALFFLNEIYKACFIKK
mgnify:CR=1 FL=1